MKKEMVEWIKTIVISVLIALFITTFIARPTLVKQHSMYPTLEPNNYLILNKVSYRFHKPERGDIVVFKTSLKTSEGTSKNLIKRVIAVEGDKIVIENGKVYVNGKELNEDYIKGNTTPGDNNLVVPENNVFVMGDNRPGSFDSRDMGTIEIDKIEGKAFLRLFPFNKIGIIN
ncbi:signal peptidase I [Maledivibacter halophilus]|uniref:Signal peptidase I n=1 Tax=Maledivibacter halophilus TaxID=36842 RepID=A0A1T5IQD3_9FIRM|nr:signal peptidase I [Maledivibacter halophilus]SKC41325.1 signal peptidase I [Maledivibacter halophilus]